MMIDDTTHVFRPSDGRAFQIFRRTKWMDVDYFFEMHPIKTTTDPDAPMRKIICYKRERLLKELQPIIVPEDGSDITFGKWAPSQSFLDARHEGDIILGANLPTYRA